MILNQVYLNNWFQDSALYFQYYDYVVDEYMLLLIATVISKIIFQIIQLSVPDLCLHQPDHFLRVHLPSIL